MNFSEYQTKISKTAIYPLQYQIVYPSLGLAGEVGELLNKIKKLYRDGAGEISEEALDILADEMGDVLWYVGALCNDLGISLEDVALKNVEKLLDRLDRGVIQGSGDKR